MRRLCVVWVGFVAAAFILTPNCGKKEDLPAAAAPAPESAAEPPAPAKVYRSAIVGSWYPADPAALGAQVDGLLAGAKTQAPREVCALILPHAGYQYSGRVAAEGLRAIAGRKFARVVVIGPSHRVALPNAASVPDATVYRTPLGDIPLDVEFIAALKKDPAFRTVAAANEGEHSVEIELPLLQRTLGDFRLVPIVVGQLDLDAARRIGRALASLVDDGTLVVASSDFTHFGPRFGYVPFRDALPENLRRLDLGAVDAIRARDADRFLRYVEETGATICGKSAIAVLLTMLPAESQVELLTYDTSGHITGDWENSVSYVAAAVIGRWTRATATPAVTLSDGDKRALLVLARRTLVFYLENRRMPTPEDLGVAITPAMRQVMGAFVTLKKDGALRGCIGEIEPRRPLYEAVMDHAVNAALRDPRFPPVSPSELPSLHVEISALTPPHPVTSFAQIVIGRDGVVLDKQGRSAVFLPQVAPEQGWGLEETLTHLSMKAGLAPDAWREGASFEVFQAIVFDESGA